MFFACFYLQINVFIIYDPFLTNRELYTQAGNVGNRFVSFLVQYVFLMILKQLSTSRIFAVLQTTLDVCVSNLYEMLFRNQLLCEP